MGILIRASNGGELKKRTPPRMELVNICTDTEAEITSLPAFGEPVTDSDNGVEVIPAKLSKAFTADGTIGYNLSPSGVWTKFKG